MINNIGSKHHYQLFVQSNVLSHFKVQLNLKVSSLDTHIDALLHSIYILIKKNQICFAVIVVSFYSVVYGSVESFVYLQKI